MKTDLVKQSLLQEAVATLTNPETPIEDRAAIYSAIWGLQIYANRALRKVKDDIIVYMERNKLKALGPLSVKATAIDVRWPVNDPDNWADSTTQDYLAIVRSVSPEYVRHVPDHLEIDTAALGEAVHLGDPVARQLHADLKDQHLRTEEGRRLSLAVKEAK